MQATNIKKNPKVSNTYLDLPELSVTERELLGNAIKGFGNLKKAVEATGCNEITIKRAIAGFKVKPDTYEKIQEYISEEAQA